jgi:ribosomal protein L37AE/L43A
MADTKKECPICQTVVTQNAEGPTTCTKCGHAFRPSDKDVQ